MNGAGKNYWRSLEQLADDPRARAFLEREFPENASEPPEGLTRRTMLTLLGASLSLAGLAACRRPVEKIVPYVTAPEDALPGVPLHYATTMPAGLSAYGLVVESHEGRPTKIEGNELHPATLGATSAALQASILDLYDPDRSTSVLHGVEKQRWEEFVAAWAAIEAPLLAAGGAGLAVLVEPFASPTLARLARRFRERFPQARWVSWEPVSDESPLDGVRRAAGADLRSVLHFDRAEVIVSLEADFLLTESDSVRHARGFADGRRIGAAADGMSRLYVAEAALSLTGANAEHRLRLPSGQVGALLGRLAARVTGEAGPAAPAAPGAAAWVEAAAHDLLAARGRGLVVAGRRQPAAVHAAALALNAALGNLGQTVTLHPLLDAAPSSAADLASLVTAMRDGAVSCLVVLGANPVHAAPADLDFAAALAGVGQLVHLGTHRDETGLRATWHVPQAHYLETWADARDAGGTASVVQPLIAPLFGGVATVELLGLVATGAPASAHDLVRETWRGLLGEADFERRWNRTLHDGLWPDSAAPPVAAAVAPGLVAELVLRVGETAPWGPTDLEVSFHPSPTLFDGRSANNGWLQELPDAVTKLTWDNAALVSPATAAALGLAAEDVVRLAHGGREIELPLWIVPGHADHTVAVHLGWGRTAAGRIGDGRGVNAYALRSAAEPWFGRGAILGATGRRQELAGTQDHGSMEGRPVVREADLGAFRERPTFARERVEHPALVSLFPDQQYDTGPQWGMTIDLTACTGCNACVTACQSENNIPIVGPREVRNGREMHWIRVDRYFTGDTDDPQAVFQPVPCMQCENAPCEQVCPVAATVHDAEGLNTMVYNRCIGTRYCSNNCPYKVRRFNFFNFTKDTPEIRKMAHNPDVTVRSRGVMEKCTYCTQRINAAKISAKLAGRALRDGDVRTACEQACPTRAITFGDIRDAESRVSRMKAQERDYVMIPELNNRPRTSYLAKIRNPSPSLAGPPAADEAEHHG